MTFLRSLLYFVWFIGVTAVLAVGFLPAFLLPSAVTRWMARLWIRLCFWGLRIIAGTKFEVRGTRPTRGVLVAAKHMSMWDTMAVYYVLGDPAIVYKDSLAYIPFWGWYLMKARMIPINRDGGASTLRKMTAMATAVMAKGRSIVIFPEGTRKKPGAAPDYKPGVAAMYSQFGVPCVPVALNSGLFWTGFIKKPGTIVMDFLEPIPPGLRRREFMPRLETAIEGATAKLIAEGSATLAAEGLLPA